MILIFFFFGCRQDHMTSKEFQQNKIVFVMSWGRQQSWWQGWKLCPVRCSWGLWFVWFKEKKADRKPHSSLHPPEKGEWGGDAELFALGSGNNRLGIAQNCVRASLEVWTWHQEALLYWEHGQMLPKVSFISRQCPKTVGV